MCMIQVSYILLRPSTKVSLGVSYSLVISSATIIPYHTAKWGIPFGKDLALHSISTELRPETRDPDITLILPKPQS